MDKTEIFQIEKENHSQMVNLINRRLSIASFNRFLECLEGVYKENKVRVFSKVIKQSMINLEILKKETEKEKNTIWNLLEKNKLETKL